MTEFLESFQAALKDLSTRHGITEDKALAVWYGIEGHRLSEEEALEAASFDGGNDRGIDFFLIDDEWERAVIAQFKNIKRPERAPKPADLALLLDVIDELADTQELLDAGRADLAEAADALQEARDRGYAVQLQFVYPGAKSAELDRRVRSFNRKSNSENVSAAIIRLDDLELLHEDYVGSVDRVHRGELAVASGSAHLQEGPYGRALVATLPGSSLKGLYEKHKNRLFDQNVRLFLGTRKGTVNAGIRDTLNNKADRGHFWAYNNGITIVARSFELDRDSDTVKLTDFSIVNGCQTTVSLGEASDAATRDASVLARIVAAPEPELVDKIIRFTNSQTPINVWDISARDRLQQRLQRELGELDPKWFYALRRGELETRRDKNDYGRGDSRRVLPFPQSAQYLAAMRGMPVEAYKDKARLFTAHKDRVFPNDTSVSDLLWSWHVGRAVEDALKTYGGRFSESDDRTAAILKRGARFFATAVTAHLLRLRNGNDFASKVPVDRLYDKALRDRLQKYANIGVAWYVSIMRTLMENGADLPVLLRNVHTARTLELRTEERLFEEEQAPDALDEKLPRLPGIRTRRSHR
jgi:AIPR protein